MMRGAALILAALLPLLASCDDPPAAKAPKKLAMPKGDSTLDDILRKSAAIRPAQVEADPVSQDFGDIPTGDSATRTILLANSGGLAAILGPLRVAGQAESWTLSGDCREGQALAPGASCRIEVTFKPRRAATIQSELVVDRGAAGPSLFLPLIGEAHAEAATPSAAPAPATPQAREALVFARQRQIAQFAVQSLPQDESDAAPSSPDYTDAGLPGTVSGFPVDRSRVLTADRYIPAVLENTLDSTLPGRAIAVVERPVFGEDGRLALIPAGSRVIGQYRSAGKYGQARLDIAWTRILRPDGVNINVDAGGADVMGRSGVPGDLDQRFLEKYGGSLLVSAIGAGSDWALAGTSTQVTSPLGGTSQVVSGKTQAANRLGNDADRLAQRMVEDNIDIRPILTVAQGTRLNIIPSEDIWLRDPNHLQPVTPAKGKSGGVRGLPTQAMLELMPSLVDLLMQSPAVQKAAPQTAQQIMQSALMEQLRARVSPPPPTDPAKP